MTEGSSSLPWRGGALGRRRAHGASGGRTSSSSAPRSHDGPSSSGTPRFGTADTTRSSRTPRASSRTLHNRSRSSTRRPGRTRGRARRSDLAHAWQVRLAGPTRRASRSSSCFRARLRHLDDAYFALDQGALSVVASYAREHPDDVRDLSALRRVVRAALRMRDVTRAERIEAVGPASTLASGFGPCAT